MRLFVALELPDRVRRRLVEVQEALEPKDARGRISFTRAENLHITLKFLGEVADQDVPAVCGALDAVECALPLELSAAGLLGLPHRGPVRIVAVELQSNLMLGELYGRVEAALLRLGFPREGRPFTPHITLARARHLLPPGYRNKLCSVPFPAMTIVIRSIALMRSELTSEGAHYTAIHRLG